MNNEALNHRAMEIYLCGQGTLENAYEQAKRELLKDDIPSFVKDLFEGKFK